MSNLARSACLACLGRTGPAVHIIAGLSCSTPASVANARHKQTIWEGGDKAVGGGHKAASWASWMGARSFSARVKGEGEVPLTQASAVGLCKGTL